MRSKRFLAALFGGLAMAGGACAQGIPEGPIAVEKEVFQYFVDDYLVENRFDRLFLVSVRHHVHTGKPDAANPVMVADKPWETYGIIGGASVTRDPESGRFRAYYHLFAEPDKSTPARAAYAESEDGVKWTKPLFDIRTYKGEPTNIIFPPTAKQEAILFQLVDVPPALRQGHQWLAYYMGEDGGYLAGSQDGIHWQSVQHIIPDRSDCQHNVVYDARRKEFAIYYRNLQQFRQRTNTPIPGTTRVISRIASPELFTLWKGRPQAVIIPEDEDALLLYGMPVTMRGGVYFGFLEQYDIYPKDELNVELRTSRDGIVWRRQRSKEGHLIRRGKTGAWDGGMIKPAGLVEVGDEWLLYYTGYAGNHREVLQKPGAMGLLRFRKEGFVSIRSHPKDLSYVITRPLIWPEGNLWVNFDGVNAFPEPGSLRVRVVDADRTEIPGFSYEECEGITGDAVRAEIRWKNASLANLAGKEIRLEFQFERGDLFGFIAR